MECNFDTLLKILAKNWHFYLFHPKSYYGKSSFKKTNGSEIVPLESCTALLTIILKNNAITTVICWIHKYEHSATNLPINFIPNTSGKPFSSCDNLKNIFVGGPKFLRWKSEIGYKSIYSKQFVSLKRFPGHVVSSFKLSAEIFLLQVWNSLWYDVFSKQLFFPKI